MPSVQNELRVLHVIPSLIKGGAERLCLDIAIALNNIPNVKAKVAVMEDNIAYHDLAEQCEIVKINSKVIPSLSGKWDINTEGYDKLLNEFKPHVIHSHLFVAELLTRHKPLRDVHYVTHLHDNMHQFRKLTLGDLGNKKRITEWYEKQHLIKKYKSCKNTYIAISKHTESYFKAVLPNKLSNRIILLNNAINFKKFERTEISDVSKRPLKLVMTGSMVNKKNQIFLLDVVEVLISNQLDVHLDLLGDGPNRQKIQAQIDQKNLQNNITMHGNVADVVPYLHQAHFYTHAATYEPFGLVLLEAMAASLVCIALDGGGNLDIHEEGKNGFVIDTVDAKLFAQKIIQLTNDDVTYQNIAKYAHNYAAQFDINTYVNKLLDIYKS